MIVILLVGVTVARNSTTFYGKCGVAEDEELFKWVSEVTKIPACDIVYFITVNATMIRVQKIR